MLLKIFILLEFLFILNVMSETRAMKGKPCFKNEFACKIDQKCIPIEWRCDKFADCFDGSDEKRCHKVKCPKSMYQCRVSKNCIHLAWICDGVQDCLDGSDEGNFCKFRKNKNKSKNFY